MKECFKSYLFAIPYRLFRVIKEASINIFASIVVFLLYPLRYFRIRRFYKSKDKIKNILILFMGEGLGDCIIFSAVLPVIRERFKDAKINLLVFKRFNEYFKDNPYIDNFFLYDDYTYKNNGLIKFLLYSGHIRKHCKVDMLIDLLPNRFIIPAIFSWFIPKKISIGFDPFIKNIFYDIIVKINWNKYFYNAIFDILKTLGMPKKKPKYWIPNFLSNYNFGIEKGLDNKTVILAPGGKFNLSKHYHSSGSFKYYPELVFRLIQDGYRVILVGAEYDIDADFLNNSFPKDKFINLLGKTTITQLFFLVSNYANLVICNTSGLIYVSLAVGVPVVFYANKLINFKRWQPLAEKKPYIALQDKNEKQVTINDFLTQITKILGERNDDTKKKKKYLYL